MIKRTCFIKIAENCCVWRWKVRPAQSPASIAVKALFHCT